MTDFLTVSTLASRWSLSDQSIRRKISSGAIPALKTPGSRTLRIPAAFVADYERTLPASVITSSAPASTTIWS
jgi:excisionase family DNA binding protein